MKKNILIVGLGSIGKRHLNNFQKYCKSIDVCDSRFDRLSEAKKKFKIRNTYQDYNLALKSNKYDAVLICTPPSSHLKIASIAVKNKCALFIEKPLGIDANGWKLISNQCKKNKLINYVAYCHRFIPYTEFFKKLLVDKKIIGKIYSGHLRWASYLPNWHPYEDYRKFYMSQKKQGGGALLDDSHGIDLIRYLLGDIKSVFGKVCNLSHLEMSSDDSIHGLMNLKNKVLINLSFELYETLPEISLKLTGSKGSIKWDRVKNLIEFYDKEKNKTKIFQYSLNNLMSMYNLQTKYFIDLLNRKQKNNINNIKYAIDTQKVIDAFFKSSKYNKLINVN
jgi:predicted dehydrogenase